MKILERYEGNNDKRDLMYMESLIDERRKFVPKMREAAYLCGDKTLPSEEVILKAMGMGG